MRRFRILTFILPAIAVVIIFFKWNSDHTYRQITSPEYVTFDKLKRTTLSGPAYVILQEYCVAEDYVYFSKGSTTTYYSFMGSCDSERVNMPVIIMEMTESQFNRMESEHLENYMDVLKLFEGRLEPGYTGKTEDYSYIYDAAKIERGQNVYTFYPERTPQASQKKFESGTKTTLIVISVILLISLVARYFALQRAKEEDERIQRVLEMNRERLQG
jgi:hypothetical protein